MSMLAEKRTKVNYILNPRKTTWEAEENNFGRKLMEKMGWSEGRGLGKTEQGITQSIKVKYKNDSKGMGYAGPVSDPVLHQDDFSQLLADLNQSHDVTPLPDTKVLSLEKRSESSRKRVHYKKFTRGKDLSRYSEKDLECIIGSVALNKKKKNRKSEEIEADGEESRFGVQTTNGGLMEDYFKEKMKAKNLNLPIEGKKKGKKNLPIVDDIFEKDNSEYDPLALFKNRVKNKKQEELEEPQIKKPKIEVEEEEVKVKKSKKNKKEIVEETEVDEIIVKNKKPKHKKSKK